jgi:LytTr DNA-binding domain
MKEVSHKDYLKYPFETAGAIRERIKSPFPYYFDDDKKNTILNIFFSLLVMLLIVAVKRDHYDAVLLVGASIFAVVHSHIVWFPKFWPALDAANWTVGKHILYSLWQMIVCCFFIPVVLQLFGIHPELSLAEKMIGMVPKVFGYGALPVVIMTLLIHNQMLSEGLKNAVRANGELAQIQRLKLTPEAGKSTTITIHSDTRESLEIHPADLLYIEASDNYSTFFFLTGERVEKKILRMNLKTVETQVNNYLAIRCHRSYVVNLSAVTHVTGNANGYRLAVRNTNFTIPVSRAKGKEVIQKIEQMRNVIEMN